MEKNILDWGEIVEKYDLIAKSVKDKKDLSIELEAVTRFQVIDRLIKEVLGWKHEQIKIEERTEKGYIDYLLKSGDNNIIIEAKKIGATFPNFTKKRLLKLSSSLLKEGAVGEAIQQAIRYGEDNNVQLYIVTNGLCWVCFVKDALLSKENDYAYLYFPFNSNKDGETFFNTFNVDTIAKKGISEFTKNFDQLPENKLLNIIGLSDTRLERNNIADYIAPALNIGLYADAILSNGEVLKKCFVTTDARTKFDNVLRMYLVDPKPTSIGSGKIKTNKSHGPLDDIIEKQIIKDFAPPVTLIIGEVGTGKSTYLKHFELVAGSKLIEEKKVHWIYIDLEKMGKTNPRNFIYNELKEYLSNKADFETVIKPAYQNEIQSWRKGVYALIAKNDPKKFDEIVTEHIAKDFKEIEPYVDKLLAYLAKQYLCVIVIDNVDLFEDEKLETEVFAEGLALSKRLLLNVIVSLRDTTYIKYKNTPSFDAFELRKFWLTPPPFKAVLSKRLLLSRIILKDKEADISMSNGMTLNVPDLSIFFDIVQSSLLSGLSGDFISYMSGNNIRKGINLIKNFLTSGHIQADKAIKTYLSDKKYYFSFHEVFKGSILNFWRYYKEGRCECVNLFDSGLHFRDALLVRLYIVNYLHIKSYSEATAQVSVKDCLSIFTGLGLNEKQIIDILEGLVKASLIKTIDAARLSVDSTVYLTPVGGYYKQILCKRLVYIESCLFDTQIYENDLFEQLSDLTITIEHEPNVLSRLELRKKRLDKFIEYITAIEKDTLPMLKTDEDLSSVIIIKEALDLEMASALTSVKKRYEKK